MAKIPDTKPPSCRYWVVGMKAFHYTTPVPTTLNPRNKELTPRVMQWMKKQGSNAKFIHMERHNFLDRHLSDVRANSPGLGGHCQKIKGCDTSKVSGWEVYCCDFLLLPATSCCSWCLLPVSRRSTNT